MLLDRSTFFIKERVAVLKLSDTYDIIDPETKQPLGIAREEPPSWAKYLRLLINKRLLPTAVNIYQQESMPPLVTLKKGWAFLHARVEVRRGETPIGSFTSKLFSLGGGFWVADPSGQRMAEIKGDWKGWNFRLLDTSGGELGTVTKKWAGMGKELFTSADNYVIALVPQKTNDPARTALLLAAGLAIDIVFKEGN